MANVWTSDRNSVVRGLASAIVLFPYTRNFSPRCLSPPRCINGYRGHNAWGGGGGGGVGGNLAMEVVTLLFKED